MKLKWLSLVVLGVGIALSLVILWIGSRQGRFLKNTSTSSVQDTATDKNKSGSDPTGEFGDLDPADLQNDLDDLGDIDTNVVVEGTGGL